MIDYIQNNTIIESFRTYPEVYVINDLQYRIRDRVNAGKDVESLGFYERTRQEATLAEGEYIGGYDLQVIDGRPVDVPVVQTMPLEDYRARKAEIINQDFSNEVAPLRQGRHPDELPSWALQKLGAEEIKGGKSNKLLNAMAAAEGRTPSEVADAVLTNADAYAETYGAAQGKLNRRRKALKEATTIDEVRAV